MRYLSFAEVPELHERLIATSGGAGGIRDIHLLESAVYQPRITFEDRSLSRRGFKSCRFMLFVDHEPSLCRWQQKGWSCGHGNVSHSQWVELLGATMDEQERIVLDVAAGKLRR